MMKLMLQLTAMKVRVDSLLFHAETQMMKHTQSITQVLFISCSGDVKDSPEETEGNVFTSLSS